MSAPPSSSFVSKSRQTRPKRVYFDLLQREQNEFSKAATCTSFSFAHSSVESCCERSGAASSMKRPATLSSLRAHINTNQ
eukprot:7043345-Prymnesium_polylepis.1